MTRTMAAEVIFIEDPRWPRWTARLLAPDLASGSIRGRPVKDTRGVILTIHQRVDLRGGHTYYEWTTPGTTHPSGNRHESAPTLSEAQAAVTRWASRRFRTEVPA